MSLDTHLIRYVNVTSLNVDMKAVFFLIFKTQTQVSEYKVQMKFSVNTL